MWKCPLCELEFTRANQAHSCHDKELADFLNGKSEHTLKLFEHLSAEFRLIDPNITIHPTKSMISFAARKRFAYVIQLGKNFIDVVLPFKQAYDDNLCFNKIKLVPGSDDYNHHLRLYFKDDINDEVRGFMRMAWESGK
jgi:predicted transport protein